MPRLKKKESLSPATKPKGNPNVSKGGAEEEVGLKSNKLAKGEIEGFPPNVS